ncbi:MAG TPA: DUF5663 domain-containing protein [Candidatus Saccharimonadales bacterium]
MFQLDDNFLQSLGLGAMPQEHRAAFLQHLREELELRVGTKLAEGMSDDKLAEFEGIIEKDPAKIEAWLMANVPQYASTPDFLSMSQAANGDPSRLALIKAEYTATKWLEVNRPNYKTVVAETLEALKQEIIANKDSLLA